MHPKLILVRHSQSRPDPARPASQWDLTEFGRARCVVLAERLAPYAPSAFVASAEPKARETARLAAARLGIPYEVAAGLHEHQREQVGWLGDEFEAAVRALFERPDQRVLGEETADQARERFGEAVRAVLQRYRAQTVAIASHGTVISLFVAQHNKIEPLPLWKSLGMPAILVLSLPDFQLLETVARIG